MKVPCLGGGFKFGWIQRQIEECLKEWEVTDRSYKELLKLRRFPHTWCPGCGIGSVLKNVAMAIKELGWNDKIRLPSLESGAQGECPGI